MHPGLSLVLQRLGETRRARGIDADQLGRDLLLGPGWINAYESALAEPPLSLVIALSSVLEVSIDDLLEGIEFTEPSEIVKRDLRAQQEGDDLVLYFMFGSHESSYRISKATIDEFDQMLLILMEGLVAGEKSRAVANSFLYATRAWPNVNPSDLWYFIIPRAFQDRYNHPASAMDVDQAQSWKRTGGWALERVFLEHYNPKLSKHGLAIVNPPAPEKAAYFNEMGLGEHGIADKADLLLVGLQSEGRGKCFGVAHVKASFAERRTDDVPLSQALMERGFTSPLLTMDCKGTPGVQALNRGELGSAWDGEGDSDPRGQKRLDIERDGKFDNCYSFNLLTEPTSSDIQTVRKIQVCSFNDNGDEDPFVEHMVERWLSFSGPESS